MRAQPDEEGTLNRTFKLVDILDGVVIKRSARQQPEALGLTRIFEGHWEAYCAQCRCQGSGS